MRLAIVELYCGSSGKKGFYNSQEIGLARAMKKRGYESVIFYPQKKIKKIQEEIVEDNILVVYIPAKIIGTHSRFDWKILLKYKCDVVQVGSDNQIFAANLLRFLDSNKIKTYNYIGTIKSDSDNRLKQKIMEVCCKRNIKAYKTHKCFAKTQAVYSELLKYKIVSSIAPVGLDTTVIPIINKDKKELRKENGIESDKIVSLFVGRMDAYKRPVEAVKMLSSLPEHYIMIMIGTGFLDAILDKVIEERKLTERVKRVKKIRNTDIHKYYRLADYFLNFNEKEIFGMSILEAMYQNCNVIAFHAPGPDEIIDQKSGFLVDTSEEMRKIIISKTIAEENEPQKRICSCFTWDKTAEKIDKWINE